MSILNWIKEAFAKMFNLKNVQKDLNVSVAMTSTELENIKLWQSVWENKSPWLSNEIQSRGLGSAIVSEIARLICIEASVEVTGSQRADYLNERLDKCLVSYLEQRVKVGCAVGGMAFKPFLENGELAIDFVPAWRFFPTSFNSNGDITGAFFVDTITRNKMIYTRIELHEKTESYTIKNLAYKSQNENELGTRISLTDVPEWAELAPEVTLQYQDGTTLEKMLFGYFRVPSNGTSKLGSSVFADAVNQIKEVDKAYSAFLWELEGTQLAVDVSERALNYTYDANGNPKKPNLGTTSERLFRTLDVRGTGDSDFYFLFNPDIREASYINSINELCRGIEFSVGLSYGTLSNPQSVSKTAEEIKSSKHRSYSTVNNLQKALDDSLHDLVYAMDFMTSLYNLAPYGDYELVTSWGDGVLADAETIKARRYNLVAGGYLKPEYLIAEEYGISIEEAREMLPSQTTNLFPNG